MTSGHPPLSVLVTVYNRSAYLGACLDSILASTWQEFEIVIVDDCSSDNSFEIAEFYAAQDVRIRLYKNDRNLGDYKNRNRAAALARGKYLKYLDADDVIYKDSLSIMVDTLETNSEAALALSTRVIDPNEPKPILYPPAQLFETHFMGRSPLGPGPSAALSEMIVLLR